jgi:hypothetical protein
VNCSTLNDELFDVNIGKGEAEYFTVIAAEEVFDFSNDWGNANSRLKWRSNTNICNSY